MVKVTARDLAIFGETNTGGNQSNGGSFTFNGVVDTTDKYRCQRAQCARTYMAGPTCQRTTATRKAPTRAIRPSRKLFWGQLPLSRGQR